MTGEMKKRLNVILTDDDLINKTINEAKNEFYKVWNNAYGSSAQQGIDIYNKWFLKWFGKEEK